MTAPASGPAPTLRTQVEQVSRPLLVRMHRQPRPLVPLVTVILVAVGVLAPLPLAWLALTVVFAFVAWIAYLSWPAVTAGGRLMRVAMLALVVGLAITRL